MYPYHLEDDSRIMLPVGFYFGPRGETIERVGVRPHRLVENTNPIPHYYPGVPDRILDAALAYLNR
jgi:C-terminal processing protease CtpA/Prc